MADCTPEFWTLKDIRDSLEKQWNGKKKIVIPMFQRGKRWDKNKREAFIDSLRKRYPIGTLLFYKTIEGTQEIYTLIDGLQRGTAIKDYLSSPSKFFSLDELNQESLQKVYDMIISAGSVEQQKQKINEIILNYVHNLKIYEDFEIFELYEKLLSEFPVLNGKLSDFGSALKADVKALKDNYNALCVMTIPAIVYTGDETTLPEIFERINSKGVALTEYEIYAASWPRKEFNITNNEVVEYILKKYDTLNDSEYAIKDYDRDAKRINKNVNAFEYVFGLSKWLQHKYNSLNFYRNLGDDETNPVAFQILNACFNTSHSTIKDVHKIITRFSDDISVLENSLVSAIDFVNKCIEPILKFKGNNRKDEGKIFHSQYQIMSLISFVFRKKYNIDDKLKVNDTWKESKQKLVKNIWKYYVYDIITKYWGEGGTGKIHTANSENRYFVELSVGQFGTAYDAYTEGMYNRHENRQVSNPSDIDYVLLNTIYVQSFSAMDQLSIDKFDVEHIATKDQMKKLNNKSGGIGLPISHFANICYLPEFENRVKKANNFYQDTEYLDKAGTTIEVIEDKYSFTKSEDLEFMDLDYQEGDFDVLQEYYIIFLKNRNKVLRTKFLTSLGFADVAETPVEEKEVKESSTYDDKYFRTTKIGLLVRETFDSLIKDNLLTDDDIFNLKDKEYSKKLGIWLPVLQTNYNATLDNSGISRYYSEPIIINGESYYLCKEWKENMRKPFVDWAKKKLGVEE